MPLNGYSSKAGVRTIFVFHRVDGSIERVVGGINRQILDGFEGSVNTPVVYSNAMCIVKGIGVTITVSTIHTSLHHYYWQLSSLVTTENGVMSDWEYMATLYSIHWFYPYGFCSQV